MRAGTAPRRYTSRPGSSRPSRSRTSAAAGVCRPGRQTGLKKVRTQILYFRNQVALSILVLCSIFGEVSLHNAKKDLPLRKCITTYDTVYTSE